MAEDSKPTSDLGDLRHVHLLGIGGVGVSGIARIMAAQGLTVSGTDAKDLPILAELTELNRTWPHIKVVLVEDRLVATVDLLGDPFVPRHLSELLQRLKGFLTVVDERFARRFDGVRYGSDREHDVELPEGSVLDEPN